MQALLDNFHQAKDSFNDAASIYKQAGRKQKEAFEELKAAIADQIKVAQVDTSANPVKLGLIGFGPRRKKSAINLPAQPEFISTVQIAPATVRLCWRKSFRKDCGKARSFIIESRLFNNGEISGWSIAGTAYKCRTVLRNQPQNVKIEYRIMASNTAGVSFPSNTITVTL